MTSTSHSRLLGGKGFNQAAALASLGARVSLVTCLGNDPSANDFEREARRRGIHMFAEIDDHEPTGVGVPLVLPDGDASIVVAPGASMKLSVAEVERAFASDRWDSVLCHFEAPVDALEAVLMAARRAGTPAFVSPAPWTESHRALCQLADTIIPNEAEARALGDIDDAHDCSDVELLRACHEAAGTDTVITLGQRGYTSIVGGTRRRESGLIVDVRDATGAGDAFSAGLVYARCLGMDWDQGLQLANACGAVACRYPGASVPVQIGDEVRALLARRELS